jgi:hypothetical protein
MALYLLNYFPKAELGFSGDAAQGRVGLTTLNVAAAAKIPN